MSKKIKKLIKKVRHRLDWPVTEVYGHNIKELNIHSYPHEKRHVINIPDHDVRDIEFLHELGHATLCETVHPMFSGSLFEFNDPDLLQLFTPAIQAANDWFIDDWLHKLAPKETEKEIVEHYNMVRRRLKQDKNADQTILCMAAFLIAQASRYCGITAKVEGILAEAVRVISSVDPAPPTLDKLCLVFNGLAALYTAYQVEPVVAEDGLTVWRLKP